MSWRYHKGNTSFDDNIKGVTNRSSPHTSMLTAAAASSSYPPQSIQTNHVLQRSNDSEDISSLVGESIPQRPPLAPSLPSPVREENSSEHSAEFRAEDLGSGIGLTSFSRTAPSFEMAVTGEEYLTDVDIDDKYNNNNIRGVNSPTEDREDAAFIKNVETLLQQVKTGGYMQYCGNASGDATSRITSEKFDPYDHVVNILINQENGGEYCSEGEVDEKLAGFYSVQEKCNDLLIQYVDDNRSRFNKSTENFSKMVMDVHEVRESLSYLERDTMMASVALQSHSEEMDMLMTRSLKSTLMIKLLEEIQRCSKDKLTIESHLKKKRYLLGVQGLQSLYRSLLKPDLRLVKCTSRMLTETQYSLVSIHFDIIDELLGCVFRKHVVTSPEGTTGFSPKIITKLSHNTSISSSRCNNITYPGVVNGGFSRGLYQTDVMETKPFFDVTKIRGDKNCDNSNYQSFILMCLESVRLLRRMEALHEAFFSQSSIALESLFSKFISMYVSWQKSCASRCDPARISVECSKRTAVSLASGPLVSMEEALVGQQAGHVTSLLSTLCSEVEKILRNVNFMVNVILAMNYPYLQAELIQNRPLHRCGCFCKLWSFHPAQVSSSLSESSYHLMSSVANVFGGSTPTVIDGNLPIRLPLKKAHEIKPRIFDVYRNLVLTSNDLLVNVLKHVEERSKIQKQKLEEQSDSPDEDEVLIEPHDTWSVDEIIAMGILWRNINISKFIEKKRTQAGVTLSPQSPPLCNDAKEKINRNKNTKSSEDKQRAEAAACCGDEKNDVSIPLAEVITYIEEVAAYVASNKIGDVKSSSVNLARDVIILQLPLSLKKVSLDGIVALRKHWDIPRIWDQCNFYLEAVVKLLCGVKNDSNEVGAEEGFRISSKSAGATKRQKKVVPSSRETFPSLTTLLGTSGHSYGPRFIEEIGHVSFSIVAAADGMKKENQTLISKKAQNSVYDSNMRADSLSQLLLRNGNQTPRGAGERIMGVSSIYCATEGLEEHLYLSKYSAVIVFCVIQNFVTNVEQTSPSVKMTTSLRKPSSLVTAEEMVRESFANALKDIHLNKLRSAYLPFLPKVLSMDDVSKMGQNQQNNNSSSDKIKQERRTHADSGITTAAKQQPIAGHRTATAFDSATSNFPLLSSVVYCRDIYLKVDNLTKHLPATLADDVRHIACDSVLEELMIGIRNCITDLSRGSFAQRVVVGPFLEALAENRKHDASSIKSSGKHKSAPKLRVSAELADENKARWLAMKDEDNIYSSHMITDKDLDHYYKLSNIERTSGYKDIRKLGEVGSPERCKDVATAAMASYFLERESGNTSAITTKGPRDPTIGCINTSSLRFPSITSVSALALIAHSMEWLGAVILQISWSRVGQCECQALMEDGGMTTASTYPNILWRKMSRLMTLGAGEGSDDESIPAPHQQQNCTSHAMTNTVMGISPFAQHVSTHQFMDCLVPGTPFQRGLKRCLDAYTSREARVKHIMQQHYGIHQFPEVYLQRQKFLQAVIAPQKRLAALYYYTQTLSQGALFHIAVDVRFAAFEFLTQIRDESYNYSMCVLHRPDAVILQYTKHIEEYLTLLSLNLGHKKRKYIALTMARPIANLFLNEMSLLRDKRISISGQQRLLVNLLTIQSSIQLFLPGDMELAEAARDYLKPVQVFLSNLKNNNVTSSLISSEDYLLFSKSQVEALIELVFHSDGANDVYVEQIMNYRRKLEVISQDSQRIDDIARADKMEQERIVNEKFIMASAKWLEGGLPNPKPAMSTDVSPVAPPVMYGKEFGNDIVGDDDESCESLSSYTDDDCTDCSTEGE